MGLGALVISDFTCRTEVNNKNKLSWISKPLYIVFDMMLLNTYYLHREISLQPMPRFNFYLDIAFGLLKSGSTPHTPTLSRPSVNNHTIKIIVLDVIATIL